MAKAYKVGIGGRVGQRFFRVAGPGGRVAYVEERTSDEVKADTIETILNQAYEEGFANGAATAGGDLPTQPHDSGGVKDSGQDIGAGAPIGE